MDVQRRIRQAGRSRFGPGYQIEFAERISATPASRPRAWQDSAAGQAERSREKGQADMLALRARCWLIRVAVARGGPQLGAQVKAPHSRIGVASARVQGLSAHQAGQRLTPTPLFADRRRRPGRGGRVFC